MGKGMIGILMKEDINDVSEWGDLEDDAEVEDGGDLDV
jgi:hypothetical protein